MTTEIRPKTWGRHLPAFNLRNILNGESKQNRLTLTNITVNYQIFSENIKQRHGTRRSLKIASASAVRTPFPSLFNDDDKDSTIPAASPAGKRLLGKPALGLEHMELTPSVAASRAIRTVAGPLQGCSKL